MNEANTHAEALGPAGESLDEAHERLGNTAPRVTPANLEANIEHEVYFTADEGLRGRYIGMPISLVRQPPAPLHLLTFCVLVLRNGFMVVGHSAPASPQNFDAALGKKLAREMAVRRLWPLMGYALRQELHIEQLARARRWPRMSATRAGTGAEMRDDMETPFEKTMREMYEARARCFERIERGRRVRRWMIAALIVAALAAILPWDLLLR